MGYGSQLLTFSVFLVNKMVVFHAPVDHEMLQIVILKIAESFLPSPSETNKLPSITSACLNTYFLPWHFIDLSGLNQKLTWGGPKRADIGESCNDFIHDYA